MITLPPNLGPNLRASSSRSGGRFGDHAADYEQLESFRKFFVILSCVILSVYLNLTSVKQKNGSRPMIAILAIIVDLLILTLLPPSAVYPPLIVLSTIGMLSIQKTNNSLLSSEFLTTNSSICVFNLVLVLIMICLVPTPSPTTPTSQYQLVFNLILILLSLLIAKRGFMIRGLSYFLGVLFSVTSICFRLSNESFDVLTIFSALIAIAFSRKAVSILTNAKFTLQFASSSFLTWFLLYDLAIVGYDLTVFTSWIRLALGFMVPLLLMRMGIVKGTVTSPGAPSPALTIVEISTATPEGLRMRPIKALKEVDMEVSELKVECPVESVASSTTDDSVVVVAATSTSVVPDLDDEEDEDALFEKISTARI